MDRRKAMFAASEAAGCASGLASLGRHERDTCVQHGLPLATVRQRAHSDEHAVLLSSNGPLVAVLRETLAQDAVAKARENGNTTSKTLEGRRAAAFVQNIHHFRDDALASTLAPDGKVAVFDEAQPAWDVAQTSKFMQQKKGQFGFSMSEPKFFLKPTCGDPDL